MGDNLFDLVKSFHDADALDVLPDISEKFSDSESKDEEPVVTILAGEKQKGTSLNVQFSGPVLSYVADLVKEHGQAIKFLSSDSEALHDFILSITPQDVARIREEGGTFEQENLEDFISAAIEKNTMPEAFRLLHLHDAILLYENISHKKESNLAIARRDGSLEASIGINPLLITAKNYRNAFSTKPNKHAYVGVYDAKFLSELVFSEGELDEMKNPEFSKKEIQNRRITDRNKIEEKYDESLLMQCASSAYHAMVKHDNMSVTVYLPKFLAGMGIRSNAESNGTLLEKLRNLESIIGIMNNHTSFSRAFVILDVDQEKQQATFSMPYLNRLISAIEQDTKQVKRVKGNTIEYNNPSISFLIRPTIAKSRNKPAVAIARRLVAGLQERGTKPDIELRKAEGYNVSGKDPSIITYRISYNAILDDVPALKEKLEGMTPSNKNILLKRAFSPVADLLKKETEVFEFYKDLKIKIFPPTMTTLKQEITITHRGKAADYKKKA